MIVVLEQGTRKEDDFYKTYLKILDSTGKELLKKKIYETESYFDYYILPLSKDLFLTNILSGFGSDSYFFWKYDFSMNKIDLYYKMDNIGDQIFNFGGGKLIRINNNKSEVELIDVEKKGKVIKTWQGDFTHHSCEILDEKHFVLSWHYKFVFSLDTDEISKFDWGSQKYENKINSILYQNDELISFIKKNQKLVLIGDEIRTKYVKDFRLFITLKMTYFGCQL